MKFRVIVSDPPWGGWNDKLKMSTVKRGADSNYKTLTIEDIKKIPVEAVADDDSILCLWVPSSLLQDGMDVMKAWGFRQTQTWVWVKTKKDPFETFKKSLIEIVYKIIVGDITSITYRETIKNLVNNFDIHNILNFGMGRLGRNVHEICLVGVKGSPYKFLKNKSQRTVFFSKNEKHSKKPEILQDRIELMFPGEPYLEMFGRRERENWVVVGNEIDGEDIRDSMNRIEYK